MKPPFWAYENDGSRWHLITDMHSEDYLECCPGTTKTMAVIHPDDLARLEPLMGEHIYPRQSSEATVTAIISRMLDLVEAALTPAPATLECVGGELGTAFCPEQPSLRDRFAMAALTGLLPSTDDPHNKPSPVNCLAYATRAYEMADAMMAAHKAKAKVIALKPKQIVRLDSPTFTGPEAA